MFIIIGADGREYGPVTVATIKHWIGDNRVNLQTRARRADQSEWRSIGDFPEFNPAAVPPPLERPEEVPPPVPVFTATPAQPAPVAAELAGRMTRLAAFFVDYLLSVLVALPGALIIGPNFLDLLLATARGETPDFSTVNAGALAFGMMVLGLGSLLLLIVQIVMLSTRGQTIGKWLLRIRVVRHPDGSPVGFVNGWLLRNFVPGLIQLVPWVGFAFYLADACFIFSAERRCLHDLIAGTQVVKT